MITQIPVGYQVEARGFVFELNEVYISVHNLDGDLMAILRVLDHNAHRVVHTAEEFQQQVDYWLSENL